MANSRADDRRNQLKLQQLERDGRTIRVWLAYGPRGPRDNVTIAFGRPADRVRVLANGFTRARALFETLDLAPLDSIRRIELAQGDMPSDLQGNVRGQPHWAVIVGEVSALWILENAVRVASVCPWCGEDVRPTVRVARTCSLECAQAAEVSAASMREIKETAPW